MGSLAVRCYLKKYDRELDGLIVCGCPGKNTMVPLGTALIRMLQTTKDPHSRSRLADSIFANMFDRPFRAENLIHAWICSTGKWWRHTIKIHFAILHLHWTDMSHYCGWWGRPTAEWAGEWEIISFRSCLYPGHWILVWAAAQSWHRRSVIWRNGDMLMFLHVCTRACVMRFWTKRDVLRCIRILHIFFKGQSKVDEEMVNYSKNSILQQAGQSMLAQANQANQGVLQMIHRWFGISGSAVVFIFL